MFDFNKVENFDEHIILSIPNYEQLFNTFSKLATIYSEPNSHVIDYGCSTGKLLLSLQKKDGCVYYGIDNSTLLPENKDNEITFCNGDAYFLGNEIQGYKSVVISMFFLQFLSKEKRKEMLLLLKYQVNNGATLLISEKVMLDDCKVDNIISRLHISEKRKNFSDKDILDKDYQLLDSMYIVKESDLMKELNEIGIPIKVWQSYNFCGYVVIKGN